MAIGTLDQRYPPQHPECPECLCRFPETGGLDVLEIGSISPDDYAAKHPDARGFLVLTKDLGAFSNGSGGGEFYWIEQGESFARLAAECFPQDFIEQERQRQLWMTEDGNPPLHPECIWCNCVRKQCLGTLKSGSQCTRRVAPHPGSDFCVRHERQMSELIEKVGVGLP